jgi:hypothetical protein
MVTFTSFNPTATPPPASKGGVKIKELVIWSKTESRTYVEFQGRAAEVTRRDKSWINKLCKQKKVQNRKLQNACLSIQLSVMWHTRLEQTVSDDNRRLANPSSLSQTLPWFPHPVFLGPPWQCTQLGRALACPPPALFGPCSASAPQAHVQQCPFSPARPCFGAGCGHSPERRSPIRQSL